MSHITILGLEVWVMSNGYMNPKRFTDRRMREIFKSLEESGVLKDADNISRDEGRSKILKKMSENGLNLHPDVLCCNTNYVFIVAPDPEPDTPDPNPQVVVP
jgi:hypothetical protein